MNYYKEMPMTNQSLKKDVKIKHIIYLGELPPNIDQYELNKFILSQDNFNIETLHVKSTKDNSCYAYVKFKTSEEAARAIKVLNLKEFKDHIIKAQPFKSTSQIDKMKTQSNIFIQNLPPQTTPKDLCDLCIPFGKIISVNIKNKGEKKKKYNDYSESKEESEKTEADKQEKALKADQEKHEDDLASTTTSPEDNKSSTYGYINFENEQNAKDAIKQLNQSEYKGYILKVSTFTPQEKRIEESNNEYLSPMVLIKNLPNEITSETQMINYFESYGQIMISGIISDVKNERMGVIVFAKKEEAEACVEEMNNKPLYNGCPNMEIVLTQMDNEIVEKIRKNKQDEKKQKYNGCNLVVKKLHEKIGDKELFDLFKEFGEISSARVSTEGKMIEKKDSNGEVIDKEFAYVSKLYGFVLFKRPEDALRAKEELNDKDIQFNDLSMHLVIEFFDYNKGEKQKYLEIKQNITPHPNNRGGYGGKKPGAFRGKNFNNMGINNTDFERSNKGQGIHNPLEMKGGMYNNNYPYNNNQMMNNMGHQKYKNYNMFDGPSTGNNAAGNNNIAGGANNGQHPDMNNMNMINQQGQNRMMMMNNMNQMNIGQMNQMNMAHNMNNMNNMNKQMYTQMPMNMNNNYQMANLQGQFGQMNMNQFTPQPNPNQNREKITVEKENLVEKVQAILNSEGEDKTEELGETLFFFLLSFISDYKLNITGGKTRDEDLCSKLTGILIKTDTSNLLNIISSTPKLLNALKDVTEQLMENNRLDK